jgi:hypothetical protein
MEPKHKVHNISNTSPDNAMAISALIRIIGICDAFSMHPNR